MPRKPRDITLPPPDRIVDYIATLTGPATVTDCTYRFNIPSAAMRSYLRRLAASGVLVESRNDSETLQYGLPAALTGLVALYQPVLPKQYTSRMVVGVLGRGPV